MTSPEKVQTLHLPNHTTFSISPVFSGLFFKSNDFASHGSAFPAGFTIVLHSEDDNEEEVAVYDGEEKPTYVRKAVHHVHRYKSPTVGNDSLFISSISQPSNDWKPPSSHSRMVALMLWTALLWYFQQPEPDLREPTLASASTPLSGQPKGEWRVKIKNEGILRSKRLLSKFERMGLIMTEESRVGVSRDPRSSEGWTEFYCTRRTFWQLDARIFLFSLSPSMSSPFPSRPGSPNHFESLPTSRAGTPAPDSDRKSPAALDKMVSLPTLEKAVMPALEKVAATNEGLWSPAAITPPGPFDSPSHLPTYFPPHPLQFTFTKDIRHPMRPKPPLQGEVFYDRFVPSIGAYLSFRCASLSSRAVPYPNHSPHNSHRYSIAPATGCTDVELLNKWMNNPRVSQFWGEQGPKSHQQQFLEAGLSSRHSFPVIALWDDKPFGYFEIYWVKEDKFGRYLDYVENWDRGFHVLVGEEDFRGSKRLRAWISALVHFCFLSDNRTQNVYLEPRVDNERFIEHLLDYGFHKVKEVSLPHKQSAVMRIVREAWEGPVI